jgi:subtilisin family serine protease
MDDAKTQTNVDDVHLGTGLSSSYKGDGVVVGIIDGGFDYTHPAFEDVNGNLRIKKVWEQEITHPNYPGPSSFNYGVELTDPNDILNWEHDAVPDNNGNWISKGSHGTHVGGIAAGSDHPTNGLYGGCAPKSELVIVSTPMTDNTMLDGINYIFNYASSVGNPAVINMSIGSHFGPHDGTSLFDQALPNLVAGNGKVLVGAAGNENGHVVHFSHSFSGIDSIPTSVTLDPTNASNQDDYVNIDAWGDPNTDFCISIDLYDPLQNWQTWTGWVCASTNLTDSTILTGSDGGQARIDISCESSSSLNSKPHIEYSIQVTTNDYAIISLANISSGSNNVNMWITQPGYGIVKWTNWGLLTAFGFLADPLSLGDNNMSVGEIGGTGTHIISVGAYTSKDQWTDTQGSNHQIPALSSIGDIAPFSSLGPTADGRTKPDITAPGNILVSSVSSFDPANQQGGGSYDRVVTNVGGNSWPYSAMEGTSMATPMVTGIIALLMDINPNLSFSDIKNLIQSTAITDNYTGTVPNNTWGAGKIDALGAASGTTPTSVNQYTSNDIFIYPNPANDRINVYIPEYIKSNQINIIDCLGKRVYSTDYTYAKTIDTHSLSKGVYFVVVVDDKNNYIEKLIIN